MLNLILFILISFGMTQILVDGTIFDKIRPKYKFFKCYMCMGFWVSGIVFLLFWFFGDIKLFNNIWIGTFLFSCLGSGCVTFLCSIYDDMGIKVFFNKEKNKNNTI